MELREACLRQDGIGHAAVARAGVAVDVARPLEAVQEARDSGRGQDQLLGEVDPAHPPLLGPGQVEETLVVVDRKAVIGHEAGIHGPGGGRVPPHQADKGIDGRPLLSQYLTRQSSSCTVPCEVNYTPLKEDWKWQF